MFENFDTLILLVGANPLHNEVVAEYFLSTNVSLKTIVLIYSEINFTNKSNTKKYADNLERLFKSRHGDIAIEKVYLSDVSNAERIFFNLREQLQDTLAPGSSVHFNYTGGTKTMAVHLYRWLERYAENNVIRISFSYLNDKNFWIVGDDGEVSGDLREKVNLNIEEIIELYGFERKTDSKNNFKNDIMEKFKEIINGENGLSMDFDLEIKGKPSEYDFDYEFQLNGFILKGFQLIGIASCLDSRDICKGKGFEILARTRQIAGEGTRAILITSLKEPQKVKLQLELEVETGGSVLVLGAEDLKNNKFLIEKLQDYIDNI